MILTAAFIISKAIGVTWSWGWLFLTVMAIVGLIDFLLDNLLISSFHNYEVFLGLQGNIALYCKNTF